MILGPRDPPIRWNARSKSAQQPRSRVRPYPPSSGDPVVCEEDVDSVAPGHVQELGDVVQVPGREPAGGIADAAPHAAPAGVLPHPDRVEAELGHLAQLGVDLVELPEGGVEERIDRDHLLAGRVAETQRW